jgi:hypothetical protein
MISYKPMTDEALEDAVLRAIDDAITSLKGLNVPNELYEEVEATIESWGGWEQKVIEDDYDNYEQYVSDFYKDMAGGCQ